MRDHTPHQGGTDDESDAPEVSSSHLTPLGAGPLVTGVAVGFVFGWLFRGAADGLGLAGPVSWIQAAGLWFLAVLLGGVAVVTARAVRRRDVTLDAQRMVNRLVLARAAALSGALLAGGYAGYALTWLDSHPDLVLARVGVGLVAAAGGVAVLVTGKWLERACRVPKDDSHP
ncbi:DUF3180 domain-containing protein [Nocardioides gilvus]|uniref:DUF3180 domain-containing protein n=1 Tax=Nocardioides gilvus TaxID=1735589 RepID=UPI000D7433EB|nr:DUF3180 domain-containing protein [Nocardioides gilvus]